MDAKDAIKAQFMKEYSYRNFTDITVKGLCAATPVARTTFYSYYNNTDEVKAEIEDELIAGVLAVAEKTAAGNFPDMDFTRLMDETEQYIKENWSYIHIFLVRQPNLRFIRKWKDAIKQNFQKSYPDRRHMKNYDAIAEMLASTMLSAYTYWMEHPDKISTADIKPLIKRQLASLVEEK